MASSVSLRATDREALAALVKAVEATWPGDGMTYDSVVIALRREGKYKLATAYAKAWKTLTRT